MKKNCQTGRWRHRRRLKKIKKMYIVDVIINARTETGLRLIVVTALRVNGGR